MAVIIPLGKVVNISPEVQAALEKLGACCACGSDEIYTDGLNAECRGCGQPVDVPGTEYVPVQMMFEKES